MRAVLQSKRLWQLVIGKRVRPADVDKAAIWDEDASMAAGDIFFGVQLDQRVHFEGIAEDPVKMWSKFEILHLQEPLTIAPAPIQLPASSPTSITAQTKLCALCTHQGHPQEVCHHFLPAKSSFQRQIHSQKQSDPSTVLVHTNTISSTPFSTTAVEFAGNASTASFSAFALSSTPLQLNAEFDWIADTGATSHMTPHRHWIRNFRPLVIPIQLADHQVVYSTGVGTVQFAPVVDGSQRRTLEFSRVLHVPALRNNLLSVLYLTRQKQFIVTIVHDRITFSQSGSLLFTASVNTHNTALLDGSTIPVSESVNFSSTCVMDISLWHRRLAHLNLDSVKHLIKGDLVDGLVLKSKQNPDPICEPCLAGKQHRNPFPSSSTRASKPLDLVHTDLHGPLPVRTHSGYRYWVLFIDDKTRFRSFHPLRTKDEVFAAFKQYKAWAETQLGLKIKCLRDDKGGEYMSREFKAFTDLHGIERQHTVRASPQQNGVAERANRTAAEAITTMLSESKLPPSFWGEALAAYVHIWNRSPTHSLDNMTPFQAWYGKKPSVQHLRVWGCTAYVHVQKDQRKGLESHTQKSVFIGYPPGVKGWKFWNPDTRKTLISNDAEFDERVFPVSSPSPRLHPAPTPEQFIDVSENIPDVVAIQDQPHPPVPDPQPLPAPVPDPPPLRRSTRIRHPPREFWKIDHDRIHHSASPESNDEDEDEPVEEAAGLSSVSCHPDELLSPAAAMEYVFKVSGMEPRTLAEALKRSDGQLYLDAAMEEIQALVTNGTWELVKLPAGRKAVGSRWVFKVKRRPDGSIERYKARLVAKGYSQRPGLDYTETFAPTAKFAALRAILAISAIEDLELESLDISSAFLNGEIDTEVYLQQPEGFHQGGPDCVWRLLKALYGLKQSPRVWNKKLDTVLHELGFTCIKSDTSIYIWIRGDVKIFVPVFVDDLTLASKSISAISHVKTELGKRFKLRDLGPTSSLLGIEITRDRSQRRLCLSQRQYISDMLDRYNLADSAPVTTPIDPGLKLSSSMSPTTPEEIAEMKNIPYASAVGSIMYLSVATRPDIAYAVGVLCRFNQNPGMAHWKAVKHLFRYLKGTMDYQLVYAPSPSGELFESYTDADHAGNPDNGKSTSGYLLKMGTGAISWSSKLQTIVALSTTEAEFVAGVHAGKEVVWFRQFLGELGYRFDSPSILRIDNQSAISVAKNPEHHGRMKHLDLRFFWLRDEVAGGTLSPLFIPTADMAADLLTKPLERVKVDRCRKLMGIEKRM